MPLTLPPARSMNAAISSPAYCRLTAGSWLRLMRPRPFGPRARNWLIASGVIGVCFSAERTVVALAHGVDRVEVHGQGGVQRVVGLVGVLDARDADVRGVVACVEHDAGDRLLADCSDQLRSRAAPALRRSRKGSPPPRTYSTRLVVKVKAGLEAVVTAQHLQRQPGGHDLGDRGRDERLVGVLGDQLVALRRPSPAPALTEQAPRPSPWRRRGPGGQQEQGKDDSERLKPEEVGRPHPRPDGSRQTLHHLTRSRRAKTGP